MATNENQPVASDRERESNKQLNGVQVNGRFDKRFRTFVREFVEHFENKLDRYCRESQGKEAKVSKRFYVLDGVVAALATGMGIVTGTPGGGRAIAKAGEELSKYLGSEHHAAKANLIHANIGREASETFDLRARLVEAATEIFHSFEVQFVNLEPVEGSFWHNVLRDLALEAVERILEYSHENSTTEITSHYLMKAFLAGQSKPKLQLVSKNMIFQGKKCRISSLYDKVALLKKGTPDKYYKEKNNGKISKYGYRLIFKWENVSQSDFEEFEPSVPTNYKFVLDNEEVAKEKMNEILKTINESDSNFKIDHTYIRVIEILEKIANLSTIILDKKEQTLAAYPRPKGPSIAFEVRHPTESFTGRDTFLSCDGIYRALKSSAIVALVGLGGIGKSELARKFAAEYYASYDGNIVRINCSKQSNMMMAFAKLTQRLTNHGDYGCGYRQWSEYQHWRCVPVDVQKVHAFFEDKNCLFIFDDVQQFNDVVEFLPRTSAADGMGPHILITSRNEPCGSDIKVLPLKTLTEVEAAALVRAELNTSESLQDEKIRRLIQKLHCMPLALELAAAYIRTGLNDSDVADSNAGIDDYLNAFEEIGLDHGEPGAMLHAIISLSLKSMRKKELGEKAIKIMEVIAFLSSDNVPRRIFSIFLTEDENKFIKEERDAIIRLLAQYSMITLAATAGYAINTRNLVQENIRQSLSVHRREEVVKTALAALRGETAEEHILAIWDYATDYPNLVRDFSRSTYGGEKNSVLHLLARNGHDLTMKKLMNNIQDKNEKVKCINACNKSNNTPMHLAAEKGFLNVIQYLKSQNARSDITNKMDRTPFHESIKKGQLHVIKYFANQHDYKASDSENIKLACWAAAGGNIQVLQYLVEEKNVGFLILGQAPSLPVHHACKGNKLDIVKYLLNKPNACAVVRDQEGNSPLHVAAQYGHMEVIKYLVEDKNVDVTLKNDYYKTPVYGAVKFGNYEVALYLLKHDKSKAKYSKYTLLHEAAYNRRLKILQYLVSESELNISINARDKFGNTPLHEASCGGDLNVVKYLVESHHAIVDACNSHGKIPLHRAATSGKLYIVKYFVEDRKVPLDATDKYEDTPLHEATYGGSIEVVKYLISKGAVVESRNIYGRTPVFGAVKKPHLEVLKYLVEKVGCKIDIKDSSGKTPLEVAEKKSKKEAVDYLKSMMNRY